MTTITQEAREAAIAAQAPLEPIEPSTSNQMLAVIERAIVNKDVDVDKMERLLAMQERIMAAEAKARFLQAMIDMRPDLPVIDKRGRIEIRDKQNATRVMQSTPYAKWEDIDTAITPILMKHGFDLTHRCQTAPDGKVEVTAVLSHIGGHTETTSMSFPHDSTGSKNAVQAVGSTLSYGVRYTTVLMLRLRVIGIDDDGKSGGIQRISEDQVKELRELADQNGRDIIGFCEWFEVASLTDISVNDFNRAKTVLSTPRPGPKKKA